MEQLPKRLNFIAYDIMIFFVAIAIFGLFFAAFSMGLSETAEVTDDMYDFTQQTTDTANDMLSIYTLLPFIVVMAVSFWGIMKAIQGGGRRYV